MWGMGGEKIQTMASAEARGKNFDDYDTRPIN